MRAFRDGRTVQQHMAKMRLARRAKELRELVEAEAPRVWVEEAIDRARLAYCQAARVQAPGITRPEYT